MLKFFIITFILIYIVARFAGFFMRIAFAFFGKDDHRRTFYGTAPKNQKKEGDVTILIPEEKVNSTRTIQGEYVDFEEIEVKK